MDSSDPHILGLNLPCLSVQVAGFSNLVVNQLFLQLVWFLVLVQPLNVVLIYATVRKLCINVMFLKSQLISERDSGSLEFYITCA